MNRELSPQQRVCGGDKSDTWYDGGEAGLEDVWFADGGPKRGPVGETGRLSTVDG